MDVYWHECEHMACRFNRAGDKLFGSVQHDIQDFLVLIEKLGVDWFRDLQNQVTDLRANDDGELPTGFILKL